MSVQETEFVVMRKRKRQVAIDPCLGFYYNISSLAASQPSTPTITAKNADKKDAIDHPGWTPLPQDLSSENESDHGTDAPQPSDLSSEPEPLTVDAFLRRNALGQGRIHVRKYGRKYRNRRIIQSDDEYVEDDRSKSHKSSGQLDDSRPALRLLPIQRLNNNSAKPKPRAIRLWNTTNAKGVPFRTSSFTEPTKMKKELSVHGSIDVQRHPLSTWSTFRRSTHPNEGVHKSLKVPPNRNHPTRCAPLVFVPLAVAEEAYNKKFHPTSMTKREVLPSFDHGKEPRCSAIAPLILVPADKTENVSSNQSCGPSSPTVPSAKFPAPDSVLESALEVSESLPLSATAITTQASPSCFKKTPSDKRLKPLGSFLGEFIERVRAATQAEDTIASRSQHQSQGSILGSESQESLTISEFISDHGLEQTHSTTHERTPGSSCSDAGPHGQPLTCSNAHLEHLHAATMRVDQLGCRASLDVPVNTCYTPQEGFPPYVPPTAPFDINAALLAYTQAGNSCIQLCSFESLS